MACNNISAAVTRSCRTNVGGVKYIYIGNWDNMTYTTSGSQGRHITAISTGSLGYFKFEPEVDSAMYTDAGSLVVEKGVQYNTHTVAFNLGKTDADTIDQIKLLAASPVSVIVQDASDNYYLLGYTKGLNATKREFTSGMKLEEYGGWAVEFTGTDTDFKRVVTGSIITSITEA